MSEHHEEVATTDSGGAGSPKRSRLRTILREALFIVGIVAIYLAVMLFVLPRLGYET